MEKTITQMGFSPQTKFLATSLLIEMYRCVLKISKFKSRFDFGHHFNHFWPLALTERM